MHSCDFLTCEYNLSFIFIFCFLHKKVVQIILRDWDIRQAVISGRRNRLIRWIYKYFEDATKLVRQFQSEGKNVTQFSMILDAEGFNPVTHGCPLCMSIYLTIAGAYEEHYPGSIDKIQVVNSKI